MSEFKEDFGGSPTSYLDSIWEAQWLMSEYLIGAILFVWLR